MKPKKRDFFCNLLPVIATPILHYIVATISLFSVLTSITIIILMMVSGDEDGHDNDDNDDNIDDDHDNDDDDHDDHLNNYNDHHDVHDVPTCSQQHLLHEQQTKLSMGPSLISCSLFWEQFFVKIILDFSS